MTQINSNSVFIGLHACMYVCACIYGEQFLLPFLHSNLFLANTLKSLYIFKILINPMRTFCIFYILNYMSIKVDFKVSGFLYL